MPNCAWVDLVIFGTRGAVLILIALGGILCIFLGWRLYRDTVSVRTAGELQAGGLRLKLVSSGPGVFLVGLGIWLLASVANRPVQTNENVPVKPAVGRSSTDWPSLQRVVDKGPAPEAAPPCAQCLIAMRSRSMSTGEADITSKEVGAAARSASAAVKRAQDYGVADTSERASLIVKLNRIAELAEATSR
jgi:hypothetical protein